LAELTILDDAVPTDTPVEEENQVIAELIAVDTIVPADTPLPEDTEAPAEPPVLTMDDTRFVNLARQTEILPDEQALAAAGLVTPADAELEQIMLEAMSDDFMRPGGTVQETPLVESPADEPAAPVFPAEEFKDAEFRHAFGEGEELASVFEPEPEPAPQPAPVEEPVKTSRVRQTPPRKRRPKAKKGYGFFGIPHILVTAVWLAIIVLVGVSLGRVIWVCAEDMLGFGREDKLIEFTVEEDLTLEELAEDLKEAGLIRYPQLFIFYGQISDIMNKIDPGTYTLNQNYDYMALKNGMVDYISTEVTTVVIPEGYNCRQIFALLEEKGICKAADLEAYAASGELKEYWFLEDVPRGDKYCLEGFLFPDTYDFYENSTPKMALEKMLDGFRYRFSEELKAQIPVLNERLTEMMRKNGESEEFIAANQLTLRDVLTVASLIEEETASTSESYRIASVIYNRLFSWGNTPRYLNIDATVIYALGGKTDLNHEDMAVDNPYNTYTNTGLTPGPISNPGLASIQAALNFEDTSYYYYTLNYSTGEHQFSKTYEEHVKWVEKFNKEKNNG
jgi:UPF0755 protein